MRHEKAFLKKGKREVNEDFLPVYGMLIEPRRRRAKEKDEKPKMNEK